MQPRNWSEFIHEFIGRQWIWSCRSEKVGDVVIDVAQILGGVGEGSLDGYMIN